MRCLFPSHSSQSINWRCCFKSIIPSLSPNSFLVCLPGSLEVLGMGTCHTPHLPMNTHQNPLKQSTATNFVLYCIDNEYIIRVQLSRSLVPDTFQSILHVLPPNSLQQLVSAGLSGQPAKH